MRVQHQSSGVPFWAKLLFGLVLLKLLLGSGMFPLLFWGAVIWFVFAAKGSCFGFRHGGHRHSSRRDFYEKRKRDAFYPDDPDYHDGKAKREEIVIV